MPVLFTIFFNIAKLSVLTRKTHLNRSSLPEMFSDNSGYSAAFFLFRFCSVCPQVAHNSFAALVADGKWTCKKETVKRKIITRPHDYFPNPDAFLKVHLPACWPRSNTRRSFAAHTPLSLLCAVTACHFCSLESYCLEAIFLVLPYIFPLSFLFNL